MTVSASRFSRVAMSSGCRCGSWFISRNTSVAAVASWTRGPDVEIMKSGLDCLTSRASVYSPSMGFRNSIGPENEAGGYPDQDAFESARTNLLQFFKDRDGFRAGYIGYPPLVELPLDKETDLPSGLAVDCIKGVAEDLKTTPRFLPIGWGEVGARLQKEVDIVIDPIMPVRTRNANIVAYCKFQALFLVYPEVYDDDVTRIIREIGHWFELLQESSDPSSISRACETLTRVFRRMESVGNGLAVTQGTFEERFLMEYIGAYARSFGLKSIGDNLKNATEDNYLFVTDEATWHKHKTQQLITRQILRSTPLIPGIEEGNWIPAGFAITRRQERHEFGKHLATYLIAESKYGPTKRLKKFLANLRNAGMKGIRCFQEPADCQFLQFRPSIGIHAGLATAPELPWLLRKPYIPNKALPQAALPQVAEQAIELHRLTGHVRSQEPPYMRVVVSEETPTAGVKNREILMPITVFEYAGILTPGIPFVLRTFQEGHRIISEILLDEDAKREPMVRLTDEQRRLLERVGKLDKRLRRESRKK